MGGHKFHVAQKPKDPSDEKAAKAYAARIVDHPLLRGKRIFHSAQEAAYCRHLIKMAEDGRLLGIECQVPYDLHCVDGSKAVRYAIDFVVLFNESTNGQYRARSELHEVKGAVGAEWKLKDKLFRAEYPDKIYRVVTWRGGEWVEISPPYRKKRKPKRGSP